MNAVDDHTLLRAIARGDEGALGALYDRYAPLLMGVARRFLRNEQEAEDLVHDVFLEVWHRSATYDPARGKVRTWLLIRARCRALDRCRSPAVARRAAAEPEPGQIRCVPALAIPEALGLQQALDAIPETQRRVIEMRYFQGLSAAEVAEREGLPLGTVKSRAAAGLQKMRNTLSTEERVA